MSKAAWNPDYTAQDALRTAERYPSIDHDGVPTLYPDTVAGALARARDEWVGMALAIAVILVVFALAVVA